MGTSREDVKRRVSNYRERLAEIRADATLSPLGKRRAIEALHRTVKPEVDKLRKELAEQETADRRGLHQRLFGLPRGADPSTVISFRDAQDRVARISSADELGELMERAASSGDELLLRAGFGQAWSKSLSPVSGEHWSPLVDEYARQYPDQGRYLEAYASATSPRGQREALADQMELSVPDPRELRTPEARLSDHVPASESPRAGSYGATA